MCVCVCVCVCVGGRAGGGGCALQVLTGLRHLRREQLVLHQPQVFVSGGGQGKCVSPARVQIGSIHISGVGV